MELKQKLVFQSVYLVELELAVLVRLELAFERLPRLLALIRVPLRPCSTSPGSRGFSQEVTRCWRSLSSQSHSLASRCRLQLSF